MANLRVLYSSNAFWAASGYGVQGRSLLPRLAKLPEIGSPEALAMFAWYGLQGGVHNVNGHKIYPQGGDPYGNDVIEAHAKDHRANVVISLIDVWVMKDTARKVHPAFWLPWLPIDHDPVPKTVLSALEGAYMPLTYAKWGHDMLEAAGVPNTYIPHGIEPSVFNVIEDRERVAAFKARNFDKPGHLTVMVAANKGFPDRKAFQVQLRAWAKFAENKPDAKLYIHTEPTQMYGGVDFAALTKALGIEKKTMFPDRYKNAMGIPAEYLALVYNSADVFMGAAMAEGFGIPIIEAQACGAPVIVTDFSAMPELVRWGYAVAPADMIWTPMNAWQAWPSAPGITQALESLYEEWSANGNEWQMEKRRQVAASIHAEYDWDTIVRDQWAPLMTRLAADWELQSPTPIEVPAYA
jgi:glycosyltransferase involved in cell wall biosynthesis